MNRCKDCKWWYMGNAWGTTRECWCPKMHPFSGVSMEDFPLDNACSPDDEWLNTMPILTGPEFGCVNFTPKDGVT